MCNTAVDVQYGGSTPSVIGGTLSVRMRVCHTEEGVQYESVTLLVQSRHIFSMNSDVQYGEGTPSVRTWV